MADTGTLDETVPMRATRHQHMILFIPDAQCSQIWAEEPGVV